MSYRGNLLVENRNGLIVDAEVFQANGTAERDAALIMMERLPGTQPLTVGGVSKVHWIFTLACAAYKLARMENLAARVGVA